MNGSRRQAHFQVEAEIIISAPAALVWAVLVDLSHYSDWNSFVYSMKSNLRVGDPLTMKVRMRPRWGWNVVTVNEIMFIDTQRRLVWRTLSPWCAVNDLTGKPAGVCACWRINWSNWKWSTAFRMKRCARRSKK